jgi:hypothetical protein
MSDIDKAISSIPAKAIEPFLYRPLVVNEEEFPPRRAWWPVRVNVWLLALATASLPMAWPRWHLAGVSRQQATD